jgi:hypothetical protein
MSKNHLIDKHCNLGTHITGVTASGPLFSSAAFINLPDVLNDASLNIEALRRTLLHSKNLLANPTINPRDTQNHRRWPLNLNIQADNATGSKKNTKFILYCALLVHYKHFEKININFMITGN